MELALRFDGPTSEASACDVGDIDGAVLMDRLLAAGVGAFKFDFDGAFTVTLNVEDDILFLFDACAELSELTGEAGSHYVFLGDGELEIKGTRTNDFVLVQCTLVPFLDRRLMKTREREVSLDSYVAAWERLLAQLLAPSPGDEFNPPRTSQSES